MNRNRIIISHAGKSQNLSWHGAASPSVKGSIWHGIALPIAAAYAMFALIAHGATTVSIDNVAQRWPWNNKIDITYTVTGGQDLSTSNFCKLVFTTTIAGATYTIDGATNVGASANSGTHTVTWTAPSGIRSDGCTISAAIYASDAPSGDDYMVIDLDTGRVSYEGMLANQDASNGRYNTATYKTDKLVLRKVAAGGTYPTGDTANYPEKNSSRTWTTKRDYYIGVFPVTQRQYTKIYGSNPSVKTSPIDGNITEHRPVETVSWIDIRGNIAPTATIEPSSDSGAKFLQKLNAKTLERSGMKGFDLPTEVMFEIAQRAGSTGTYSWEGSSLDTAYFICTANSGSSTVAVGSCLPNNWGLYDTAGNVFEWCRDSTSASNMESPNSNMADFSDPFTPQTETGSDLRRVCRGGGKWNTGANSYYRASCRYADTADQRRNGNGFRIAIVME